MSSLWNRSGMVERYADDLRADGAKAYFFNGGTTTPLTVYQDSSESSAHPHPVVADANGRWPDVFVPFIVSYDVRVTSKDDVQLTFTLRIPNPDPIEQTVVIPPDKQVQTGMIHPEFVNTTKPGYVRLNGKTIGSTAAGGAATERANDDTLALYTHLWDNLPDSIAPVSGGRGASAPADFGVPKVLTLPDMRGRAFVGLDDMGNTALATFAGLTFTLGSATQAGSTIGINKLSLALENMPPHTHGGTTAEHTGHTHSLSGNTGNGGIAHTHTWGGTHTTGGPDVAGNSLDHTHSYSVVSGTAFMGSIASGPQGFTSTTGSTTGSASTDLSHTHTVTVGGTTGAASATDHTHPLSTGTAANGGAHTHTFTTDTAGGDATNHIVQPFNNMPLTRLITWFIKL